ncbi:MAG: glycosyltransferase family 4 protein [Dysgonomonas sp.]
MKTKLIRTSTVPISLSILLNGQLAFLNKWFFVIGVSSPKAELSIVEQREGIETKGIEIKRNISPFNDLVALWHLYLYFRKEKPLIVHSITPKAGLLSMLAARLANVPIRMHTFTGLIFPYKKGFFQKLLIIMDKILCKCATNINPEGNGVKNDLLKYKITNKPLMVLGNGNVNGIDTSYFDPSLFDEANKEKLRNELNIKKNDFVFIFVGRLVTDKGINELIKAFKEVNSKFSQTKLLLVGPFETDLDPLKEDTIKEIKSNPNIITTGFQNDVRPYFIISDAFVFPSYREGFPNVVMQAGAMGLPAIVTDINGSNEIIIEGVNGTIIPSKDDISLVQKMILFISDKDLLIKLKSKAREMIKSRYEQQMVWNALLTEYQTLEKEYKENV